MNRNAFARLVIYSIITVILIGVLLTGLNWNGFDWDADSAGQTVTGTASVDASSIKRICIEWVDGTVDVRAAQQDTITFSETNGEKLCMVYSFKGDTLVIRYSKESLKLGINIKTPDKHLTFRTVLPRSGIEKRTVGDAGPYKNVPHFRCPVIPTTAQPRGGIRSLLPGKRILRLRCAPLRMTKRWNRVPFSVSLRGAKRRGNLPVQPIGLRRGNRPCT